MSVNKIDTKLMLKTLIEKTPSTDGVAKDKRVKIVAGNDIFGAVKLYLKSIDEEFNDDDAIDLCRQLLVNGYISKVNVGETRYGPICPLTETRQEYKVVNIIQSLYWDKNLSYIWIYDNCSILDYFYTILCILGTMMLILYPLWPRYAKLLVWYLSILFLGFLLFLLVLAIVRLILYSLIVLTTGAEFWLFPNLFEDVGFFESFVPLYSVSSTEIPKKEM